MPVVPRIGRETDGWRPVVDLGPTLLGSRADPSGRGASRRLNARIVHVTPGVIDVSWIAEQPGGWIGLLILDGVLMVEIEAGRAHTGWLMGADDLIRPWDMTEIALTQACRWRALTPTRIALLDPEFSLRAEGVPAAGRALIARTARTTNWLLAKSLMLASPVVEERLLLAFALLGERWGTVNHEGVLLRLPLTHALLATLCGVRRPSVTIALGSLQEARILARRQRAWLLRREPPDDEHRPACWPQYARALGLIQAGAARELAC